MYRSLFGGLVFFPDLLKCKKGDGVQKFGFIQKEVSWLLEVLKRSHLENK